MNYLRVIIITVFLIVGVAFLTLLERKLLRYIQHRKGPSKVGVGGFIQPFRDGIKLFCKENLVIFKSNYYFYYVSPVILMLIIIMNWILVPWVTNIYYINYSILLIFVFMRVGGHMLLLIGWRSNSLYSLIGAIRFVSQAISYEVSFILIVYRLIILRERFILSEVQVWQEYVWNLVLVFPLFLVFFFSVLAELNRGPLDLVEGESELVSGFNIEYFGGRFALIFLGEYGRIIFFCFVILMLFRNIYISRGIKIEFLIIMRIIIFLVIFMRGILPRVRYDELIYLCWKIILPLVLNYLMLVVGIKFFMGGGL